MGRASAARAMCRCVPSLSASPMPGGKTPQSVDIVVGLEGCFGWPSSASPQTLAARTPTGSDDPVILVHLCGDGSRRALILDDVIEQDRIWRLVGKHPHCADLVKSFIEGDIYHQVSKVSGPTIRDMLKDVQYMERSEFASILRGMLSGLAHIHSRHVVHRDVRPCNFVFSDGVVKLTGFHQAAQLLPGSTRLWGHFGLLPYMSPEMVGDKGHTLKTDMWSLGVTIYVMVYGELPYRPPNGTSEQLIEMLLYGVPQPRFAPRTENQPPEGAEVFIRALLEHSPRNRLSAEKALSLPFVARSGVSTGPVASRKWLPNWALARQLLPLKFMARRHTAPTAAAAAGA